MYTARFTFLRDRAPEFLTDGQYVTEMEFDSIHEIVEYVQQFADALEGSLIYCQANGEIVDLEDFTYSD